MVKTTLALVLSLMGVVVGGCSSSSTSTAQNSGGVAGLLAQSMPGAVSQNGQNVTAAAQTAANSPNPNTIATTINTANGTTTPGTVSSTLSPASIMAAIAAVQAANAAKQQNPQTSPNAIGPGLFMVGPGVIGVNTFQGPPAFVVRPSN